MEPGVEPALARPRPTLQENTPLFQLNPQGSGLCQAEHSPALTAPSLLFQTLLLSLRLQGTAMAGSLLLLPSLCF